MRLTQCRIAVVPALLLLFLGCSHRADDCNYTLACVGNDAGEADAGSSGGNHATGGIGGAGGSSIAGGTTGASGGTIGAGGNTSGTGGITATGGVTSACNPACSGTKPVCNGSAKTCVECTTDGNCSGATPACNTSTNTCAQCMKDSHCSGATPVCDTAQYICVQCLSDANCSGATPACKTASDADSGTSACVQCTKDSHCSGKTPLCDTSKNVCVQCKSNADCTKPEASLCSSGTCSPCTQDTDCTHISGKTVCNTASTTNPDAGTDTDAGTNTNTCVQCTGTDYSACGQSGGKTLVCNTLTATCSTLTEHSAGLCKTCVSDAQCPLGEMCTEELFHGQSVGYFCFYKQGDTANGAPASCFTNGRPYSGVLKNAVSIDDQTADICSLRVSTCAALNEFSQTDCTATTDAGTLANDQACGFAPGVDSKCAESSTAGVYSCTTTCLSDLDCRMGVTCDTGANPPICTFQ